MTTDIVTIEPETVAKVNAADIAANHLLILARTIRITDEVTTQEAADLRNEIAAAEKVAEEARKFLVQPLNDHVKAINDRFRSSSEMRKEALQTLRLKLVARDAELRAEAERAEAEAEIKRVKEQARLDALAAKAAARGDDAKAEEFAARAEQVALAPAAAVVEVAAPSGITFRATWKAEVTDLMELVRAVAAEKVPLMAVMADPKFLGATARATKGSITWPGVRWVAEKTVASAR